MGDGKEKCRTRIPLILTANWLTFCLFESLHLSFWNGLKMPSYLIILQILWIQPGTQWHLLHPPTPKKNEAITNFAIYLCIFPRHRHIFLKPSKSKVESSNISNCFSSEKCSETHFQPSEGYRFVRFNFVPDFPIFSATFPTSENILGVVSGLMKILPSRSRFHLYKSACCALLSGCECLGFLFFTSFYLPQKTRSLPHLALFSHCSSRSFFPVVVAWSNSIDDKVFLLFFWYISIFSFSLSEKEWTIVQPVTLNDYSLIFLLGEMHIISANWNKLSLIILIQIPAFEHFFVLKYSSQQ